MPGVVGIASRMPRDLVEPQLRAMVASLRHEPFYEVGTWIDESLGIYVGWCALKGSFADCMPLRSEDGSVTLMFSGEEFPAEGTLQGLKQRGHSFDIDNCEYLVHQYEEDPNFLASLNGLFHGVLIDRARQEVQLFNDRYGIHRLYYHESDTGFYFAAEAKAILSVHPHLRQIDDRGLGEFVSCGCVLENRTLFENIFVLPGGAQWSLRQGSVRKKGKFFEASEWEEQSQLEPEAYYHEIREIFSSRLSKYFKVSEPLGMSLTGGLDTRMIMAWQRCAPGSLPCYTFVGAMRECQDVTIARRVARVCRQPYSSIQVGHEFLRQFPTYAERAVYLTDGCVDVNRSVDLYINEVGRTIAPVRMTGNYGGEVMRRIRAFKPVRPPAGLYNPGLYAYFRQAETTYIKLTNSHPLSFAVFEQAPWHHYGLLALERTQLTVRTPYLDNDFVRMVFRAPESCCRSNDICRRLISDGDPRLSGIRTDRGQGEDGFGSAVRRALLEFQFKAEYAFDYGMPQWAVPIDRILSPLHLERLFLGSHKFAHFRVWYRDLLSEYVREILLDPQTLSRPCFEPKKIEGIVADHVSGRRNYTLELHKLLTIELIHRMLLDHRVSHPLYEDVSTSKGI